MTERIYYSDVTCKQFEATVRSCVPRKKKGYEVMLDRTAFYPEGGGQPGDRGRLGEAKVVDTRERGEDVIHLTDAPLGEGEKVIGILDWTHRFSLMQNHSGEHIVSGIFHRRLGANNVGFHMGHHTVTVDFDVELTPEQLTAAEREANRIVWDNGVTEIFHPTAEELKAMDYRSKKELEGDVRIVTFPGADTCACCGTHVTRTGEIGLIKLLSVQKFKEGSRIEMLCGDRALDYVNEILEQNHRISVALSAKPIQTADAVARLKEEKEQMEYRLNGMEQAAFRRRAEELTGIGNVTLFEPPMAPDSVRKLAVAVMETCGGRCAVFAGDEENGYKYAIGEKDGDLRAAVKEFNRTCNGRGGGKPFFVQGSAQAGRQAIEEFWR